MSLLIKNGRILSAENEYVADIFIEAEKITAIGENLDYEADEIIDATGKYVFPGGVDDHTHYAFPFGPTVSKGFETTNGAAVGGTTTIVDFTPQPKGVSLKEALRIHKEAQGPKAMVDYALHALVMDSDVNKLEALYKEVEALPELGVATLKLFMVYKGTPFMVTDDIVYNCMKAAKKSGVTIMVHAENADIVEEMRKQLVAEGKTDIKYHAVSRPPFIEDECVDRAINISKMTGTPLFVAHVCSKGAAAAIRDANMQGYPVYGEVCTHYLLLDEALYDKPDKEGCKWMVSPPLRTAEHRAALWNALNKSWLQAVSSDHFAMDYAEKLKIGAGKDFTAYPNGFAGVEDRLALLWTYGVEEGRISKQRFVDLFATSPAKLIGLYPEKGQIAVGADADIVIYDAEREGTISVENSRYQGVDYNAFEGMRKKGQAEKVFLRGHLVAEDGNYVGTPGEGKFLHAKPYGMAYENVK